MKIWGKSHPLFSFKSARQIGPGSFAALNARTSAFACGACSGSANTEMPPSAAQIGCKSLPPSWGTRFMPIALAIALAYSGSSLSRANSICRVGMLRPALDIAAIWLGSKKRRPNRWASFCNAVIWPWAVARSVFCWSVIVFTPLISVFSCSIFPASFLFASKAWFRDCVRACSVISVCSLIFLPYPSSATSPKSRINQPSFASVSLHPLPIRFLMNRNSTISSSATPPATVHAAASANESQNARDPYAAFTTEERSAAMDHQWHERIQDIGLRLAAVLFIGLRLIRMCMPPERKRASLLP